MNFGGGGMKRPLEGADSGGSMKKNPLEVMQTVIKNSQRDLQQKTSDGLPRDPEALKQIFTRQQMLLELQTEMMTEMAKGNSEVKPLMSEQVVAYPKKAPKTENDDFYYGFNMGAGPPPGPPGPSGRGGRRFNEDRHEPMGMGRRGGPPDGRRGPRFGPDDDDDDYWGPTGMGMGGPPMRGMGGPRGRFGPPGPGPMGPGPRGFVPPFGPPRGQNFRGQNHRGVPDRRKNIPKDHKGRGLPPTPEDSWDYHAVPGNPLNRPYNGLPCEDRLTVLKREIFKYDNFPQPLRLIETARHNYPDAHLRTNYVDEPVEGSEDFIGYLDINGVLIAVERGVNKIDAKVNCYAEALYLLSCKPTSYIYSNCARIHDVYGHPSEKIQKRHSFVRDRLSWMLDALHEGVCSIPRSAPNRDFEEIIYTMNLSVTHVIKEGSSSKGYKSDLYVDDLYISSGEGIDKFEATKDAYAEARSILFKDINPQMLDRENRLTNIDFFDPSILDIKHSEFKHRIFTNIETLSRKGAYTPELLNRKDRIIAIVPVDEKSDWKCLDETAAANDLLMEYIENNSGTSARCTVFLQGLCYADSYSSKEESARSVAMGRAKFILLKRCTTVIERKNVDFNNVALTFEQIVEKAGELCMSQPKLLDGKTPPTYQPSSDKDPQPNDLSPWVDEFLRDLILNYGQTDGLDDLIISHLPSFHSKVLNDRAVELNVAVDIERHKNVAYTIVMKSITKRLSSDEFIEYLKSHDSESGRFKLTFKEMNEPSALTPLKPSDKEK
ncbi:hypothetical protein LOTGIDRAFT_229963 [Lottia gigantea]|uniref:Uncharacterized protein n=1 Tax=Lottia gigantea TaxID=225164 RepID=V4BGC8_LOTGI|nr:hypothetical protein LOTGIDRAFT_229963 [Lottia gigantea]ESP04877.1 hypothetical protein LOTGIDRAFT_229963 [Lottia gigantea]